MTATTPKQSARLLACGVDPNTADMCLISSFLNATPYCGMLAQWIGDSAMKGETRTAKDFDLFPAWSLSALLTLLPKELCDFAFSKWYDPFSSCLEICDKSEEDVLNGEVKLYYSNGNWIVDYDWDGFSGTLPQSENPVEAVVLAIELLHINGYDFANHKNEKQ